jgi:hypothetical protein
MLAEKKHSDNGNEDEYLHHARIASTGKPSHPIRAGSYPKLTVHCHLGVTHQMHSFETTELNSWKNKRGAHRWGATGHTMQGRLSFWLLLTTWVCTLVHKTIGLHKNQKVFKIFRHIKSFGTCMNH